MSPDVMIIMGSKSDMPVAERATKILEEMQIAHESKVASAHRTPDRVSDIVKNSDAKVFIAIAGLAAALPGAVAAHTHKPVIGVPVSGKVNLDSILSIIQMPKGVPVAAVGLDRGDNAAILAAEILGVWHDEFGVKIEKYRKEMSAKALADAQSIE